jgi:enoyl-[acyl-carrier protein] reductase III
MGPMGRRREGTRLTPPAGVGQLVRALAFVAFAHHVHPLGHAAAVSRSAVLRRRGRRAAALQANVAEPESVDEMFAAFRDTFPRLDIVVSNAASGVLRPAADLTRKHWRWCLETNALAFNLLAQRAAPLLGAGARIVALSSLGAARALPDYAFVGASKAALESLVRSWACELGPRGIAVNAVSAGLVDTEALAAFPARAAMLAEFARRTPIARALTPEDVAGTVYLLCLPESAMITGQTVVVDGGYSVVG